MITPWDSIDETALSKAGIVHQKLWMMDQVIVIILQTKAFDLFDLCLLHLPDIRLDSLRDNLPIKVLCPMIMS